MYEQCTREFHEVMELANRESQRCNHKYIEPRHALLALTILGKGIAVDALRKLDVDLEKVRLELEDSMQSSPKDPAMGKLPQTQGMKNVIIYAMEERQKMNHRWVGTQHILLGLLREQEGLASLWNTMGVTHDDARAEVIQMGEEGETNVS